MKKNAVIGIIFQNNNQSVLILKRRDVPVWVLPGGGVEDHETPEAAILREIKEETGIDAFVHQKIAEYFPINSLADPTHIFECKTDDSNLLSTGSETELVRFCPINSLPRSFFLLHHIWLKEALEKKVSDPIIKKPISQVTYWSLFSYFCSHPILTIRFFLSRLGLPINSKK